MPKSIRKAFRKSGMRWWIIAAVLFTAAEILLPFLSDALPRYLFGMLSALAGAGAFATRMIAQHGVSSDGD